MHRLVDIGHTLSAMHRGTFDAFLLETTKIERLVERLYFNEQDR